MLRSSVLIVLLGFGVLLTGCLRQTAPTPALPEGELTLGTGRLKVEIAADDPSRTLGLMHRESLPEERGMLFVFETPRSMGFWMKDTLVPLSIAYLDSEGRVLEIYNMEPRSLQNVPSQSDQVVFALEVNRGWFARNAVSVGTQVRVTGADWESLRRKAR
ncbi:MAG: DUF192 domain-containing protein [Verrucomicrobiae bacterium]|nr:DUF192 domain-containing protein [Verrucomicrobiae bacterium]